MGYLRYVSLIIFSFEAFCSNFACQDHCPALVFHYLSLRPHLSHPKAPLDQASEMSLVLSGFEAGKKNFLQLTDKDGEQPQIASVSLDISLSTNDLSNDRSFYRSIFCSFIHFICSWLWKVPIQVLFCVRLIPN